MADKPAAETDTTETASDATVAAPAAPLWVGLFTWIAVALVALVALQLVGIIFQAAALKANGLTFSDKLGYAFLQNLDQAPLGFELLVAVILAMAPVVARQRTTENQDRAAQFVLVAVAALALLIAIGGIIGVPARFHIIHLTPNAKVTSVVRRVLFTFVVRNVGTALLALAAAVGAVRARFAPRIAAAAAPAP